MKVENGQAVFDSPEEEAAFKTLADAQVAGLKTKNSELLGKISQFKQFEGIDPAEYKTLKEQAAQAEEARALKAGEFDNLKKQLLDAHGKEKATLEAKIETLNKSVTENVLKAQITDAIAKADGSTLLLSPHVGRFTKLDENYRPVVTDESGNVRVKADGTPMAIADLIAEMKTDVANYGGAFKASGANGSGQQQSNGTTVPKITTMKRNDFETKNADEKMHLMKSGVQLID